MRVLVVGAGLMGAQIGVEYALGGHEVSLTARNPDRVRERVEDAFAAVLELRLAAAHEIAAARARVLLGRDTSDCDLCVESVPEDLALKAELLRTVAAVSPGAILATNTSSLSITELGGAIGAPKRTIGTHYWNPPLLTPLVEVVAGEQTSPDVVARVRETLEALGKRPVLVRDVPGFVWNRLQMAVLREAAWIVENGVASPDTVDEILTYGLARRWRNVGFFRAIALGGVETWERAAKNLLPEISAATEIGELVAWVPADEAALRETAAARDRGLAEDLRRDRGE